MDQSAEVAHRELLKEVSGTAAELHDVGQCYTSNGISNEVAYVYLATGVDLGEAHREPTELMEMRLVPVEEALHMARSGQITDSPSALALLWCEQMMRPWITTGGRAVTGYVDGMKENPCFAHGAVMNNPRLGSN